MKEELISYETALLAKDKGFDEITKFWWEIGNGDINDGNKTPCLYSSPGNSLKNSTLMKEYEYQAIRCGEFSAPTQSLLQKWLREKHNIHIYIKPYIKEKEYSFNLERLNLAHISECFTSYEEALEKGLLAGLKRI